jgi:hypothetical protein
MCHTSIFLANPLHGWEFEVFEQVAVGVSSSSSCSEVKSLPPASVQARITRIVDHTPLTIIFYTVLHIRDNKYPEHVDTQMEVFTLEKQNFEKNRVS